MPTHETIRIEHVKARIEASVSNLAGSIFADVRLAGARFDDVDLSSAVLHNVNLSGTLVHDANLSSLEIRNANLSGACITHSLTEGMTIDGIPVADLLSAYRAARAAGG